MYTLRKATTDDYSFAYNLNKTNMKDYVVKTWGAWNEEFQKTFFEEYFQILDLRIIVVENEDVGIISFNKQKTSIIIDEIQLMPQYQHKGIGTLIFSDIINNAQKENLEINLKVLKVNLPAQKFYNKLGFEPFSSSPLRLTITECRCFL